MNTFIRKMPTSTKNDLWYEIIDEETREPIGRIEYTIDKNKKVTNIDYVYIFPEHREKGILKSIFPEIINNIKCEDVDLITLDSIRQEATDVWKRMGFVEKYTYVDNIGIKKTKMEKDISDIKADCNLYKL